eukprot:178668-Rhodomonas_salina.3
MSTFQELRAASNRARYQTCLPGTVALKLRPTSSTSSISHYSTDFCLDIAYTSVRGSVTQYKSCMDEEALNEAVSLLRMGS